MGQENDDKQAEFERRRAEMRRLLERHMDSGSRTGDLAADACVSRGHFHREFRRVMQETPADMQRRLRLERAADDLARSDIDVWSIAFDAGYTSIEGFSRAFRRAYGEPPSRYRKSAQSEQRLLASNRLHSTARNSDLRANSMSSGGRLMDLVDRMLDNEYRSKRAALQAASALSDAQLDAPLFLRVKLVPWMEPDQSIRQALERLTDTLWVAEMFASIGWEHSGDGWRDVEAHSVDEITARLDAFYAEYAAFVQHVKENNLWETTWIDGACEPAETFTYATVIEAGFTHGAFRTMVAQRLIEQAGGPPAIGAPQVDVT